MSEETPEEDGRINHASGIIAAGKGKIKITQAMKLVGFTTPERKNITLYQKVRRLSHKMHVVPIAPRTIKKSSLFEVESALSMTEDSELNGVSSDRGSTPSENRAEVVTPRRLETGATPASNATPIDLLLDDNNDASASAAASSTGSNKRSGSVATEESSKRRRRSSKQVQQAKAAKNRSDNKQKKAMKLATTRIKKNRELPKGHKEKLSDEKIVKEVNLLCDSNISHKTAASYVRKGLINVSPQKRGPVGHFPKQVFDALTGAYATFLKLEQAGAKQQSSLRQLSLRVNAVVNEAGMSKSRDDLTRKLRNTTSHMFDTGKANVIEQRRVEWTTHYNLNLWFDTWKTTLIELGFAREKTEADVDIEGEVVFLPGQKNRILNVDETDGTLDDTRGQTGGRPPVVFSSTDVPSGSTSVNKCGYKTTLICGSTAAGEPIPPHFQFKTLAKTIQGQRISVDWFALCPRIYGKFGHDKEKKFPVTFGMNGKGGMDSVELQKYIDTAILPLYPDIADVPGKRVLMKVDSGPGRSNLDMLASTRLKGLYLMPGVPNTTQVTQETDQSYGQFKSSYRRNLRILAMKRQPVRKPIVLADLAVLVFGGEDRITGTKIENTFEKAFSHEKNLSCWKKCGAVPLTRSPLQGPNVRMELERAGGESNEGQKRLKELEHWNHCCCDFLTANGYAGFQLKMHAPIRRTTPAVTVPNTKARVQAIREAKSSGMMFYATGGQHLNSDDFFIARALDEREGLAKNMRAKKAARLERIELHQEAKSLLCEKAVDLTLETEKKFLVSECKLLCKWKQCKLSSNPQKQGFVSAYVAAARPSTPEPWSQEDEDLLLAVTSDNVELKDTALGVATKQMAAAVSQNMGNLDEKSRHDLLQSLAKFDVANNTETPEDTRAVI